MSKIGKEISFLSKIRESQKGCLPSIQIGCNYLYSCLYPSKQEETTLLEDLKNDGKSQLKLAFLCYVIGEDSYNMESDV